MTTTLSAALRSFELAALADGVTERTVRWYVWLLDESPHACLTWLAGRGVGSINRVTVDVLRQYIGWLRKQPNTRTGAEQSPDTIAGYIRAMHRFFSWCAIEYDLPDPMARIAFPKANEQRPKAIDLNDFMAMFAVTGPGPLGVRNRALLMFLLDTGCRAAGLCALKVHDMDFARQRAMVVEKGDRARMVVWTEKTAQYLAEWDEWRSPVATFFYNTTTQKPLTPNGLRNIIQAIGRRAGVQGRVNPHSFRHAFAREYILNGGDLATLSRLLGHRQSQTTTSYYAVFTNDELATVHEQYSPVSRITMGDGE